MSYWIFKCNPSKYNLDARLKDPEPLLTWTVTRFQNDIKAGDIVFLWRSGEPRGIVATIKVLSNPVAMFEMQHEKKYWDGADEKELVRVVAEITNRFIILLSSKLKETPGLEDLSVFHGFQQATNFPVRENEGEIILKTITSKPNK